MLLILALSLLSGLAAAVGYVSWREMTDKTFRVPSQVETDLALPFLGCFPRTARTRRRGSRSQGARARFFGRRSVGGEAGATCSEDPYDRAALAAIRDATRQAANVPASPVIGIISALPGEGRSSVARRLARFFSQGEQRALIIDADVSPRLSKLPVQSGTGATSHEVTTDIDVVAASVPVEHTPAWIADSVAIARQRYAATVIDMPPLTDTTDLSVFGTVDVVVLVIAWGRTDRAMVAEALQALPVASDRIIGVVLNDVDTPRLRRLARDPRDRFHLARSLRRHALSH